jgi:hypothetical protein
MQPKQGTAAAAVCILCFNSCSTSTRTPELCTKVIQDAKQLQPHGCGSVRTVADHPLLQVTLSPADAQSLRTAVRTAVLAAAALRCLI